MSSAILFMILFIKVLYIANGTLQSGDANPTMEQRLVTLESKSQVCEQRLSTLESQSQTSEQKYAAVLSNVLSKLSSNTDDIRAAKSQLNTTFDQLHNELKEIRADGNSSSETDLKTEAFRRKDVRFEAGQPVDQAFPGGRLSFTKILFNAGGGYQPGVFTAPVSGTYLIWFIVDFTDKTRTDKDVYVTLEVNGKSIASDTTQLRNVPSIGIFPYLMAHQTPGAVRGIYPVDIPQNDTVSFRTNVNGFIKASSSYGGIILNSHID